MPCEFMRERLSAFVDNELQSDERLQVEDHLAKCALCQLQVSQFVELGNLMRRSESLVDTQAMWDRAVVQMGEQVVVRQKGLSARARWVYVLLATAASIAIGYSVLPFFKPGSSDLADSHVEHEHESLAVDFQDVFRLAQNSPDEAISKLVAKYQGKQLDQEATTAYLGYEPTLFRKLPSTLKRVSTHVLNMPCCKCSATICDRDDGSSVVVFEHKEEQPVWFGDSPSIETQCAGKTCRIVESAGQLAVTWKNGDRQLTLVGAKDISEVNQWVASTNL